MMETMEAMMMMLRLMGSNRRRWWGAEELMPRGDQEGDGGRWWWGDWRWGEGEKMMREEGMVIRLMVFWCPWEDAAVEDHPAMEGVWVLMHDKWGRLGFVMFRVSFISSLDFFSLKTSSSSLVLETLAQINNYGIIFSINYLFLTRLDSLACKTHSSTSYLLLFI